jgi:hypothetical protein
VTWEALYTSELQGFWGLAVPSTAFLLWLLVAPRPRGGGAEPRAARFVRAWAVAFTLESIADAILPALAGAPQLPFVLLGDFRVFLLLEVVAAPTRPRATSALVAAAWTLVVPAFAWSAWWLIGALRGPQPETVLWLVYEVAFVALALWLRDVGIPRRRAPATPWLRTILAYVAAYYALWALSDVLILAGADVGWGVRIVPNQLYYSLWTPFAWASFFSPRYAAASTAAHASR